MSCMLLCHHVISLLKPLEGISVNVCSVLYASTCSYLGKEPRKQVFITLTELVFFYFREFLAVSTRGC